MKLTLYIANNCPLTADSPKMDAYLKEAPLNSDSCIVISDPDSQSEELVDKLIKEFGANSENYLMSNRRMPSKYTGTGTGNHPISSYISVFLVNEQGQATSGSGKSGCFFFDKANFSLIENLILGQGGPTIQVHSHVGAGLRM